MKDKFNQILNSITKSEAKNIKLLAVSKRQSVEKMQAWLDFCQEKGIEPLFGENYVQEFEGKKPLIQGNFKSHLIGPLQSNKVKKAVSIFDCIQSVQSLKILKLINKEAKNLDIVQNIYIQINISEDSAKSGFNYNTTLDLFNSDIFKELKNINLMGLMCITAFYENKEEVRKDYKKMLHLKNEIENSKKSSAFNLKLELSMGMSADYIIAIEEGATMVRIGSSIFGKRT